MGYVQRPYHYPLKGLQQSDYRNRCGGSGEIACRTEGKHLLKGLVEITKESK